MNINTEVVRCGSGLGLVIALALVGCAQEEPTDAERKRCFDLLMNETAEPVPVPLDGTLVPLG